jgi:hypothetical protein
VYFPLAISNFSASDNLERKEMIMSLRYIYSAGYQRDLYRETHSNSGSTQAVRLGHTTIPDVKVKIYFQFDKIDQDLTLAFQFYGPEHVGYSPISRQTEQPSDLFAAARAVALLVDRPVICQDDLWLAYQVCRRDIPLTPEGNAFIQHGWPGVYDKIMHEQVSPLLVDDVMKFIHDGALVFKRSIAAEVRAGTLNWTPEFGNLGIVRLQEDERDLIAAAFAWYKEHFHAFLEEVIPESYQHPEWIASMREHIISAIEKGVAQKYDIPTAVAVGIYEGLKPYWADTDKWLSLVSLKITVAFWASKHFRKRIDRHILEKVIDHLDHLWPYRALTTPIY